MNKRNKKVNNQMIQMKNPRTLMMVMKLKIMNNQMNIMKMKNIQKMNKMINKTINYKI